MYGARRGQPKGVACRPASLTSRSHPQPRPQSAGCDRPSRAAGRSAVRHPTGVGEGARGWWLGAAGSYSLRRAQRQGDPRSSGRPPAGTLGTRAQQGSVVARMGPAWRRGPGQRSPRAHRQAGAPDVATRGRYPRLRTWLHCLRRSARWLRLCRRSDHWRRGAALHLGRCRRRPSSC